LLKKYERGGWFEVQMHVLFYGNYSTVALRQMKFGAVKGHKRQDE
jgi:hypothetical protein